MTNRPTETMIETRAETGTESRDSIEIEVLLRSLEKSATPLSSRQLQARLTGPFRLPVERIEEILARAVGEGKAFRYPGIGASRHPRYWTQDPEPHARESLRKILATRALSMSELRQRMRTALRGMSETARQQLLRKMIRQMTAEGVLHEWPSMIGSRVRLYSVEPPAPRDYVEDAIARIAKKLGKSEDEVRESIGATDSGSTRVEREREERNLDEKLLERMVQVKLAAAQGAPLPLRDLWDSLRSEGWSKDTFDRIVLNLSDNYRVTLLRHDFPAILSESERAEMVADRFGNYYLGIALR